MSDNRFCEECGCSYSLSARKKSKAGGLLIHCDDCGPLKAQDEAPRYKGVRVDCHKTGGTIEIYNDPKYADEVNFAGRLPGGKQCNMGHSSQNMPSVRSGKSVLVRAAEAFDYKNK